MKWHPILFSGEMVRAIRAGLKTQTRRILTVPWNRGKRALPYEPYYVDEDGRLMLSDEYGDWHDYEKTIKSPYGVPGDRLWVKETHQHFGNHSIGGGPWREQVKYRADGAVRECGEWHSHHGMPQRGWWNTGRNPWTPAIFMPRRYSRLTLRLTDVRVQRLQEISLRDIAEEGTPGVNPEYPYDADRTRFKDLWDSINNERAPWNSNPWVWALTFKRQE